MSTTDTDTENNYTDSPFLRPDLTDCLNIGNRVNNPRQLIHKEDWQILFDTDDEVWFLDNGNERLSGLIQKLNPKRALVDCEPEIWNVPYNLLNHVCERTAKERKKRMTQLVMVATHARNIMDHHGLGNWSFKFNNAKNLGSCRHTGMQIQLSRKHALNGTEEQITDTILHEVAHAIAGPFAGHGPVWKDIARQLGAIPKANEQETDQLRKTREKVKSLHKVGDSVSFFARGRYHFGCIEKMNPKRAKVLCAGGTWSVPYQRLEKGKPN
ncbi:MAG: SprT-like domain-containing protein [Gammaproteobacteria bacterium]|nr:SprT-like domain-containing protein [Gammaproteobacteria bacterium]